jgi:nicotinate phosphoribosyltransferase
VGPRSDPGARREDDEAPRLSQYEVLRKWQVEYRANLLVFLPDTYGSTQFLDSAP